jgi:hypothetical protein
VFAHDPTVFDLDQTVVAGVPGTTFGLFDEQLAEQAGDRLVDELQAVFGVKALDSEGDWASMAVSTGSR